MTGNRDLSLSPPDKYRIRAVVLLFAVILLGLSLFAPPYVIGILNMSLVAGAAWAWGFKGGVGGSLFAGGLLFGIYLYNPFSLHALVLGVAVALGVGATLGWILETLEKRNRELSDTQRQLETILELLPDATFAVDRERRVILWNRAAEEMTGIKKEEMLGRGNYAYAVPFYGHPRPLLVDLVLGDSKEWEARYRSIQRRGDVLYGEGFAPLAYGGRGLHFWTAASFLYDDQGRVVGAVQCIRDIGERRSMEEKLRYLGTRDTLTDLYNRSFFEEEMARLEEGGNLPVSIIVADIDNLKIVNDALGHDCGDELLKRAARVFRSQFRSSDVVARIGGDEFAVILPHTDRETAEEAVRRVRNAVEEENRAHDLPLGVSLGAATAEKPGQSFRDIFKEADDRMYRDKLARGAGPRSGVVRVLKAALAEKDFIAGGHAERIKETARLLAEGVGLSFAEIQDLCLLAEIHDIGKLGVAGYILLKPSGLTEEEREEIKQHPDIGYRIALSSPELAPVAELIRQHHEWWNGQGYPRGLRGEEINILSRILAIADAYDAMTSERPYRNAMSREEALAELQRWAGKQFDPQLVEVFVRLMGGVHLSHQ